MIPTPLGQETYPSSKRASTKISKLLVRRLRKGSRQCFPRVWSPRREIANSTRKVALNTTRSCLSWRIWKMRIRVSTKRFPICRENSNRSYSPSKILRTSSKKTCLRSKKKSSASSNRVSQVIPRAHSTSFLRFRNPEIEKMKSRVEEGCEWQETASLLQKNGRPLPVQKWPKLLPSIIFGEWSKLNFS